MSDQIETIERLLGEYQALAESPENQRRLAFWEREVCARDQFHGRPRPNSFRAEGQIPLQIDVQHTFFTQVLPQDLSEFYLDPASYLRFYLAKRIFAFRNLADDTPLDGVIPIYGSTPFETSLFGVPYHMFSDKEPLIDQSQPAVRSLDDIERLPPIDFFKSGMMPMVHRLYQGVSELVRGRLAVEFTEWLRGPFGVALYLRGYQELLIDLATNPELAHALMERINFERKNWFAARCAFLRQPMRSGSIFNDEVDAGVIGARHYRQHILPFEEAIGQFHGGISYWHSCGDTAPMARSVSGMGCVEMLDVSGWTDLEAVLSSIDAGGQRIEVRFNPVKDLQDATPEQMAAVISQKVTLCRRYDVPAVTLRVSGIQPWKDVATDIAQVNSWLTRARMIVERVQSRAED